MARSTIGSRVGGTGGADGDDRRRDELDVREVLRERDDGGGDERVRGVRGPTVCRESLYVDRDSIYETTRDSTVEEALKDDGPLTQFGRAMKELEVELILAHSPQAKGRVERRHGVFQDRFVKALRLKKIDTLEGGERLSGERISGRVERAVHAWQRGSRPTCIGAVARGVKLEHVLSYQEQRVVQNDWTVSWCNRIFQLDEWHQKLSLARKKILVSELLDGTIRLTIAGENLRWTELPERPAPGSGKRLGRRKEGAIQASGESSVAASGRRG